MENKEEEEGEEWAGGGGSQSSRKWAVEVDLQLKLNPQLENQLK